MIGRRRLLLRGGLVVLALVLLVAAGAFLSWKRVLTGVAGYLVVSEEPVTADLVVVHAGDPERVAWGAELVSRGLAPRLLLFLDPRYQKGFFGLSPEEALERTRQALEGLGVPRDRVVIVRSVYSTWDEGRHAAGFLEAHPEVARILVVSSPFHMRRVRSVWEHALEGTPDPPELIFVPVPWDRTGLSLDRWWTREEELIWVQNEYVKLVLYHLRYF